MTPSTALRAILEHNGLLALFDHWSFSDEVGAYKPAAEIFAHAAAGLGVADVPPSQLAHVGDLKRTDIAGALGVGWTAIRYTGAFDDAESDGAEATHVVASHLDLPAVLGLA
jgi:putative hydrolase of the HAD superfamily